MNAQDTLEDLRRAGVIPVIRTSDARLAEIAVDWLGDAGFRVFEVTMTIPDATALIARLTQRTGVLIGAGTVFGASQARDCLAAGARFVVSPAVVPTVAEICRGSGAACLLGAMTPTEVHAALAAGSDAVKIFPAGSVGGPAHLKALRAVFPDVALCPTGGVDAENLADYLAAGAAFVGVGGKLVDTAALAAGDRQPVLDTARRVLAAASKYR